MFLNLRQTLPKGSLESPDRKQSASHECLSEGFDGFRRARCILRIIATKGIEFFFKGENPLFECGDSVGFGHS